MRIQPSLTPTLWKMNLGGRYESRFHSIKVQDLKTRETLLIRSECNFSVTDVWKNDVFSKKRPTFDRTEKSKLPEMLANVSETSADIWPCRQTFHTVTGRLKKTLKLTTESPVIFLFFKTIMVWRIGINLKLGAKEQIGGCLPDFLWLTINSN